MTKMTFSKEHTKAMNMNHDGNNRSTHLFILLTGHHCAQVLLQFCVTVTRNEEALAFQQNI